MKLEINSENSLRFVRYYLGLCYEAHVETIATVKSALEFASIVLWNWIWNVVQCTLVELY